MSEEILSFLRGGKKKEEVATPLMGDAQESPINGIDSAVRTSLEACLNKPGATLEDCFNQALQLKQGEKPSEGQAPLLPEIEKMGKEPVAAIQTAEPPSQELETDQADINQPLTSSEEDIRSFLTTEQKLAKEMTHEPKIKMHDYSIRPEVIAESIKKGFSDFAALPGYAVDVVNWPLHKLGITPKEPIGGSEQIRKGWQLLTDYSPVKPQNAMEEYAAKAAEFTGSGLILTGKMGADAAIEAAAKGASALKAALGVAAVDTSSSIAAGIGAETTGSIFEQGLGKDFRGTGEMLGGMSFGMMPYYIKNLAGGASNIRKAAKDPALQESVMENAAKQQVLDAMGKTPHAEINLQRAVELQNKIKGFNPNLAAATDSPGLKAFQESLDSKSVGNLNRSSEAIENSVNAVQTYYRTKMPKMDDDLLKAVEGKYTKGKKRLKAGVKKTEEKLSKLEGQYQRQPSQRIGEKLIELKGQRLKEVRAEKTAKYNELYKAADEIGINAQVDDIKYLVDDIEKADVNAFQNMPGVYNKIKSLFKPKEIPQGAPILDAAGQPIQTEIPSYASFEKLHSLSREINREYGKALRSGDSAKEYYLNTIRGAVNQKLKSYDDPVFGDFAAHKKAVDTWWKDEYYDVFKQGLGANIEYKTLRGDMTAPEKIINKLVLNKGTKGLQQFNKLYEGVPEAQILLREGIIDSLAKDIQTKGFTQKTIDSFSNRHKEVLDGIPDLRNAFGNTAATVAILSERRNNAISASKKFIDVRNSKHAKLAGFDTLDEALYAGFKDKSTLQTLVKSAKTKAEKQDLATGLGDYILDNKDPWSFLKENEKKIKPILNQLGEGHYKNVKEVAEAMSISGRYSPPKAPTRAAAAEDPFKKATGTSFISAFAQFRWAFFYGKTSAVYPFVDIGSKYLFRLNQNAVEKLIEQSIYDPDLAKTLATLTQRKKVPMKVWSNLSKSALNNGLKATSVALDATPRSEGEPSLESLLQAAQQENQVVQ